MRSALVEPWGLAGDRRWMLVDAKGVEVTARKHPRLLLVTPSYTSDGLLLERMNAAALRVPIATGQALVKGLRGRISGLAQPTYILDIPGGHGKAVVEASTIRDLGDGCYAVEDFRGEEHAYPPRG